MSRRAPNPAAERAAQNQTTLKSLVKLEANKSCADCKRNKHPRWASWNLGVFICIRCSGIHRGMGTHISRVKSVDLDSWTDEQLQSMLRWGNARANRYWEAKLAPGHIPSEAKIENFIRTKYDSKRWIMDGPMPDPATLDAEADDDVPLNVVQEKAKLERSASQRATPSAVPMQVEKQQAMDIFGDDMPPSRPSTGPPVARAPPPPKGEVAPPKQSKPADSLLGLDFFGSSAASVPARPSSTTGSAPAVQSRPDLKQSILSLYAAKPARQPATRRQHSGSDSFGGLVSPGLGSPASQQSPTGSQPAGSAFGGLGGMTNAFNSLNVSSTTQQASAPAPFADLMSTSSKSSASNKAMSSSRSGMGSLGTGGSFFDPPLVSKAATSQHQRGGSVGGGLAPSAKPAGTNSGDLFSLDFGAPPPSKPVTSSLTAANVAAPSQPARPVNYASSLGGLGDPWGSNDPWASSAASTTGPISTTAATTSAAAPTPSTWGNASTPAATQDDDFGGWSSAPAHTSASAATTNPSSNKPASGGDDLFGNPW